MVRAYSEVVSRSKKFTSITGVLFARPPGPGNYSVLTRDYQRIMVAESPGALRLLYFTIELDTLPSWTPQNTIVNEINDNLTSQQPRCCFHFFVIQ
jgi:hypothetical protein